MSAAIQPFRLPGHIVLPEPQLRFGSNDARDVDMHPMEGLIRFGCALVPRVGGGDDHSGR